MTNYISKFTLRALVPMLMFVETTRTNARTPVKPRPTRSTINVDSLRAYNDSIFADACDKYYAHIDSVYNINTFLTPKQIATVRDKFPGVQINTINDLYNAALGTKHMNQLNHMVFGNFDKSLEMLASQETTERGLVSANAAAQAILNALALERTNKIVDYAVAHHIARAEIPKDTLDSIYHQYITRQAFAVYNFWSRNGLYEPNFDIPQIRAIRDEYVRNQCLITDEIKARNTVKKIVARRPVRHVRARGKHR